MRPRIRYLRADDGVRLAWAESGSGPPVLRAGHWITHLELESSTILWPHWLDFWSTHFRLLRYDERGSGMSDRDVGDIPLERAVADLDAVYSAAGCSGPVTVLGVSHGVATAIAFSLAHPEKVGRLVLYGGYAQGILRVGSGEAQRRFRSMLDLIGGGWDSENPTFRQLFTSRFIPDATAEQLAWFNSLCLAATSADHAVCVLEHRAQLDISDRLSRVSVPTLVMHARHDQMVSLQQAKLLASEIPGAEFVELDSRNHIVLEGEPAWARYCDAVLDFTEASPGRASGESTAFAALSPREREVLGLLTTGLGNAQIASRLGISEKTVRNHVSSVFDKLGVWTRAQAIVFARDHDFRG